MTRSAPNSTDALSGRLRGLAEVVPPPGLVDGVMAQVGATPWLGWPARFAVGACSCAAWMVAVQQMVAWSGAHL